MGKVKYPNPKFFKAKDNMDWAAQAENLKLVGGIFWDMFKETDWKSSVRAGRTFSFPTVTVSKKSTRPSRLPL